MQLREPVVINNLVKNLIEKSPYKHKLQQANVVNLWNRVMPTVVTRRTEQIYIKESKIFVKISSGPLRHELQCTKYQVLELLKMDNSDFLITDIVFMV